MEKQTIYNFHKQFVFRTPMLPIWKEDADTNFLFSISQQAFFKEAIYLASPVLFDEMIKWHNNEITDKKEIQKLVFSLYKYYSRMQSRCTPYGLFAGCGSGIWGNKNSIVLDESVKRHTRLDMNFLCALAQKLNTDPVILKNSKFYPNNSIYKLADTIRYVEYKYVNNIRIHQISSVYCLEELLIILEGAKQGATINNLCNSIVNEEITHEDAENYIIELISNQLLVSELEPAVTGNEFIYQIIETLGEIESNDQSLTDLSGLLQRIQQQIQELDCEIGNNPEKYRRIYSELKSFNLPTQENYLFQTDLYKKTTLANLDITIQQQLIEGVIFLNKLFPKTERVNLKQFKDNFHKRYETKEMSLLHVLDTESGIGYDVKDIAGINKFLEDVYIPSKKSASSKLNWDSTHELIHRKLTDGLKNKLYSITFTDDDIKTIDYSDSTLPDSLPIMFKVVDSNTLYFQSCGGSSAANLLGRFAHGDQTIHQIITDIVEHEQMLNENKILAEIVHLPESRVGNVLLRPALREFEIPYLGKSSLPDDKQINLQDIMVSLRGDKIILRSKKHNKEIIPRLSTAHNYSQNALPVYQFLCDLQTQYYDKFTINFTWGSLNNSYKFLPRAQYKNIILSRARWQLSKTDIQLYLENKTQDTSINVNEWRKSWNMPQYVVLVDNDNELLIDFENKLSVDVFIDVIKKREKIILAEFLFNNQSMIVQDAKGNGYTNECIAVLLKNKFFTTSTQSIMSTANEDKPETLSRDFHIGSEWLYYKLYCGVKTADKLLGEVIKPLTEKLIEKKLIQKFFFIRYQDPEPHIRLRFHLTSVANIGDTIQYINDSISKYTKNDLVSKIQIDTYNREIERYGSNSIDDSEVLFYIDSVSTLNMIALIDENEGEDIRWQFALRSITELLNNFKYLDADKIVLLERLKEGYTNEHSKEKELKFQLDNKFRQNRSVIENILNKDLDTEREIYPLIEILNWKEKMIEDVAASIIQKKNKNQLEVDFNGLVASYIHMVMNRIFRSRQRTYEMIIYDFLYRYYKSKLAKEEKNKRIQRVEKII